MTAWTFGFGAVALGAAIAVVRAVVKTRTAARDKAEHDVETGLRRDLKEWLRKGGYPSPGSTHGISCRISIPPELNRIRFELSITTPNLHKRRSVSQVVEFKTTPEVPLTLTRSGNEIRLQGVQVGNLKPVLAICWVPSDSFFQRGNSPVEQITVSDNDSFVFLDELWEDHAAARDLDEDDGPTLDVIMEETGDHCQFDGKDFRSLKKDPSAPPTPLEPPPTPPAADAALKKPA